MREGSVLKKTRPGERGKEIANRNVAETAKRVFEKGRAF